MIIWSGHGILIPIFGVIGAVLGGSIGAFMGKIVSDNLSVGMGLGMILAGWGATVAVLVYAKTIGKTSETELLDPKTRAPVVYRKRHTFFFIPAVAWPFICGASALVLSVAAIPVMNSKPAEPGDIPPAQARFSAADLDLMSDNSGTIHGNNETAISLATEFSRRLKFLREMGISQGKKNAISLSGGEFLTHCELSQQGVAFMVHVPSLRKFNDEAKDFMAESAVATAIHLASQLDPKPEKVAVGIRGAVLYDRIVIGRMPPEGNGSLADSETFRGSKKDVLVSFFDENPDDANYTLVGGKKDRDMDFDADSREIALSPSAPPAESAPTPPSPIESPLIEAAPDSAADPLPQSTAPEPAASPEASATPPPSTAVGLISLPTEIRDWESTDGRPLQASLVRFTDEEGKTAEFRRADGQIFTIPVDRFAKEDQEFLHRAHEGPQ